MGAKDAEALAMLDTLDRYWARSPWDGSYDPDFVPEQIAYHRAVLPREICEGIGHLAEAVERYWAGKPPAPVPFIYGPSTVRDALRQIAGKTTSNALAVAVYAAMVGRDKT